MPKQTSLFLSKQYNTGSPQTFTNSDSANTKKTIFTGGADDSRITSLTVTSDDTSARVLQIWRNISSTDYLIGSISIPAASGTDGSTARVSVLSSSLFTGIQIDKDGNYFICVPASQVIKASLTSQVTSGKTVTIVTIGEDF